MSKVETKKKVIKGLKGWIKIITKLPYTKQHVSFYVHEENRVYNGVFLPNGFNSNGEIYRPMIWKDLTPPNIQVIQKIYEEIINMQNCKDEIK